MEKIEKGADLFLATEQVDSYREVGQCNGFTRAAAVPAISPTMMPAPFRDHLGSSLPTTRAPPGAQPGDATCPISSRDDEKLSGVSWLLGTDWQKLHEEARDWCRIIPHLEASDMTHGPYALINGVLFYKRPYSLAVHTGMWATCLFPHFNLEDKAAASELIKANVEPVLEQYRPIILSSLTFSKFTLGTVAPQFTAGHKTDNNAQQACCDPKTAISGPASGPRGNCHKNKAERRTKKNTTNQNVPNPKPPTPKDEIATPSTIEWFENAACQECHHSKPLRYQLEGDKTKI
ncbi:synaptotagmin-5 [Phtheirospermum japonicum]|uniref:Synaptotagmin-5 n=1 Tax=Phtheirospermum japonicum TaxID=374723 RepID=A0A830BEP0_9LAMI|nr:synaptotagmin-5 [Phtheirospermum japonicum]